MAANQSTRFRKRRISEINVVPYIDVMLVLLVIFMVTAPMLTEGVQVELPQTFAKTMAKDQEEPVVVSVDAKGQYYINIGDNADKPLSVEKLITRVAAVGRVFILKVISQSIMVRLCRLWRSYKKQVLLEWV